MGSYVAIVVSALVFMCVGSRSPVRAAARPLLFTKITVPVPPLADARFGAACFDSQRWWLGGSLFTNGGRQLDGASGSLSNVDGVHRPALWRSENAVEWTSVVVEPRTGYGEVSELFTLACNASGLVAIGAATGGAHGNQRTVSWVLDADGILREAPANFELYNGPRQIGVRTISTSPGGWTILGTRVNVNGRMGASSWTSASGRDFVIHDDDAALSALPDEQTQGLDMSPFGSELLAVGERWRVQGSSFDTDGIAWTSPDGITWKRWAPDGLNLGGRSAQRAQRVIASDRRVMIAGTETGDLVRFVAWTRDEKKRWKRSSIRPLGVSDDVLSNVTGSVIWKGRYVVGARVGEQLAAALSPDGRTWRKVSLPDDAPSGSRAKLTFAQHDGALLVGAKSENGGAAWLVSDT